MKPTIILLPGNGNASPTRDHWFPWLIQQLQKLNYKVIARDMPDPDIAHMHIWLPFIEKELKAGRNSIIIGHSSGGVASLRYLETHKLFGAILVGVNHTDLGFPEEKAAGWHDAPWQWQKIKQNAVFISHFASTDDPFIPIAQQRFIAQQLNADYHEFKDRGHFMLSDNPANAQFPELIEAIIKHAIGAS